MPDEILSVLEGFFEALERDGFEIVEDWPPDWWWPEWLEADPLA